MKEKKSERDDRYYLFATANRGKLAEAREVCERCGIKLVAPWEITAQNYGQFGLKTWPGAAPEVPEHEPTYQGNAKLKAEALHAWCGLPAIADDAGLEVDILDGRPGVYSARYGGPGCTSEDNIDKLLAVLGRKKERTARFRAVICCRLADEKILTTEGVLEGEITAKRKGRGGFGYDSVFLVKDFGKTLAELKDDAVEIKTHRILAFEKLCAKL